VWLINDRADVMNVTKTLLSLAALALSHCGVSVAPMNDASTDSIVDATTPTTVTFVVTTRRFMRPTPLAAALVRAETAEGDAIESVTDANGRVSLSLASNQRWDVTFAHRDTGARSIMGLRPEATRGEIPLWMPVFYNRLPSGPGRDRAARLEDAPTRRVRLAFPPSGELTSAYAGPAVVFGGYLDSNSRSVVLEYGAIDDETGIDVVLTENRREEGGPLAPIIPIGVIHRRIEPVPQGDIDLTVDEAMMQPAPEPSFVNVLLPSEGRITAASTRPWERVTSQGMLLLDRWSQMNAAVVGTISTQPPTAASPWRLRMHVSSRELLRTDELGPRYRAEFSFGAIQGADTVYSVYVRPDPANPQDVRVPVLHRLDVTGARLEDVRIEAHGAYEQLGFEVISQSPDSPSGIEWIGWSFDPMDAARPATLRIPRLPGGTTLASLLGAAEGLYRVNAVVSTLPRSKPAYGFWRPAHETVRVSTSVGDLQP
jgi:hypothetical protein